jgi:hypothetical protein
MNNQGREKNHAASDDASGELIDTRPLRCTDGLIDPLLERLKHVHGERKVKVAIAPSQSHNSLWE